MKTSSCCWMNVCIEAASADEMPVEGSAEPSERIGGPDCIAAAEDPVLETEAPDAKDIEVAEDSAGVAETVEAGIEKETEVAELEVPADEDGRRA